MITLLQVGKDVSIHETAKIHIENGFIGDRSIIGAHATIEGSNVRIGCEAWIGEYAEIGGGSCFDPGSILEAGDFLHMGRYSHLNQGRRLVIGHEFGCGAGTKIFTHGAYESAWEGFPVQWGSVKIGDRVWLPNAWVNPGVSIGSNVVVAAMSLVNTDLPDGCLAGGIPCRVLRERAYPRVLTAENKLEIFEAIFASSVEIFIARCKHEQGCPRFERINEDTFSTEGVIFDIAERRIEGKSTEFSEILKNQLRRNGIRFRYYNKEGEYTRWGP